MSDAYAPEASSPGIEAARRASGDIGLLGKSERTEIAKSAMRGSRTVEPASVPAHSVSSEQLDRETIKTAGRIYAGERELAAQAPPDPFDEWSAKGRENGYLNDEGELTDAADGTDWLDQGEQAGYFPDAEDIDLSQLSDEQIGHVWRGFGEEMGWVDEQGEITNAADPEWVAIGQQAGYIENEGG